MKLDVGFSENNQSLASPVAENDSTFAASVGDYLLVSSGGGGVGESIAGQTVHPYDSQETSDDNTFLKTLKDPVVASAGAEIFNDYENNIAAGRYSRASGFGTQALGDFSESSGWLTIAGGYCSVASGRRNFALGSYAHAEGIRTSAPQNASHSEGEGTNANGGRAHAEGYYTTCSHNQAHAEGMNTVASAVNSHAEGWGTTASGQNSFAGGKNTTASATNSTAKGQNTIAAGANQTALGKYNIKDTSSFIIVGKGTSDTARSNAFTLSSAGAGWFAGAVTSNGADYAELFEWLDGNPDGEDRIGMVVTLEGDKIRPANEGDDILGIITGTAMVLGDNAMWEWKDKYLTDDYGRIIYDEPVEEFSEYYNDMTGMTERESMGFHRYPKLNPGYNPNQEYISRENRKEWDAVGLLGKLHVNDDGSGVVGGYVKVGADGVVTVSEHKTNMRVMKRITDNVILVMMK